MKKAQTNATALLNEVLCKPLKYKDTISFVRLAPRGTEIEPGTLATIVGWGMTKYMDASSYPAVLQTARIPILNIQTCNKHYREVWALTNYQICAGYKEGGIDACMLSVAKSSRSKLCQKMVCLGKTEHLATLINQHCDTCLIFEGKLTT
uniref:Peptidase S1 domain-containing protein n=1 Tax=Timema poppense TaxID=170557 RepID=A0A7R9DBD1_TIMPO|nr:unnamed protein product [Timema poppensis]